MVLFKGLSPLTITILYSILCSYSHPSCELHEMQARLTDVLGLHRTNSTVSLDSITSFAGNIGTKEAYKKFCKSLYQIGVTADVVNQKETEILSIFESQNTATTGQGNDSSIENQSPLPVVGEFPGVETSPYYVY